MIKKLNLTHKKDLRIILNDFNLVLNDGDKAVIIGEEGNGKSTLMKRDIQSVACRKLYRSRWERIMGHFNVLVIFRRRCSMKIRKTIYEYFSEEEIFWEKTPKELPVIVEIWNEK